MNGRLVGFGTLITLPALALCVAGGWFWTTQVPKLDMAEKSAVTREYRQTAESVWNDPTAAEYHGPRRKGWRQIGRVGKNGRKTRQLPWGHDSVDGRELVWVGADEVAGNFVEPIATFDFRRLFAWMLPSVLALFLLLTGLCLRFFIRYATDRDDFMAATAHDLTTPLVALRRLIGRNDEEARRLAERMMRLVKNLTDFLALHGRRPPPKAETFDLRRVYADAYALFADDFRFVADGRDVGTEGPDELPVVADETMTTQIVWNLLANELKYAAPFGRVAVRFEAAEDLARIVFTDEGKGLSASERRRIFRRYYRAKSIMKCGKGGFGIGLSTSRDFARAMGGDLTVAANAPHGCVFTLTLRRAG